MLLLPLEVNNMSLIYSVHEEYYYPRYPQFENKRSGGWIN
jgi:hypothetical protein